VSEETFLKKMCDILRDFYEVFMDIERRKLQEEVLVINKDIFLRVESVFQVVPKEV